MPLDEYKRKRDFKWSPEPKGKIRKSRGELHFVVQKHHATRLHFDFRLELDGVLKSFAVPKGPSLDPNDKRLAVMVEDHPLDYMNFEGEIPKGSYGAGKVEIWDKGLYHSSETLDPDENIKKLRRGLEKGDLKFVLFGKKLKGEFVLARMKDSNWLLIKKKDQYARTKD